MWEAVGLALGLAMDATAVAAARGTSRKKGEALGLPVLFAAFQAGMAALGWLLGRAGAAWFQRWDHWIAFVLLVAIAGKMLVDAWRGDDEDEAPRTGVLVYLALAVATSIDAAAAGITLPLLAVAPWVALSLIGGVTLACAAIGYVTGGYARRLGPKLEVFGAIVLIALGVRILVQHA